MARVVEMLLASKMVYAIKFYPIPQRLRQDIQNSIFNYFNFPKKVITIGQREAWKIKKNGGCKLVNIQIKSETSKAKWLMEITTNPDFKIHLQTFSDLVGVQKGDNKGKDLIFTSTTFITQIMKIHRPFYKEAMQSLSTFRRKKGINDPVGTEKIYFTTL